ncbi:Nuclear protein DGCR14 [Penicillium griseofulvum]|uniref:Nuclear protein DGCR14 n=1 Tax=Penicillium patulum TaxID=5078 RepID=A0A135LTZ5_PENPA|nr:Nuclear protein DGCR14 [Penicillium griseofulvum]KXG52391.1 Nuclear protein DGCR14 [Penicillium griseofulvum]
MASPPSQLVKQSAGQLMPPPPPPKRIKRPATVLDEDIYTNTLSHIIARDFFPGLLETQMKQEYLEALESKDKAWIASSKKKLADVMRTPTPGSNARRKSDYASVPSTPQHFPPGQPGDTPHGWGGDTPMSVISTSTTATETQDRHIPDVSNMGLVAFQAKYTSEDNESFNKVLDKQNEKRREKYPWLWSGNKIPSARQIAHHQQEIKRITAQGGNPETGLVKKDEHAQPAIKTDLNARPANPDTWKTRPDNTLMFLPSSVEDTHETLPQKAEMTSRAGLKRTLYQNTRLLDPHAAAAADAASAVPPSPSLSAIQDAIAGRPHLSESEAASAFAGSETPRVNGYAFVDEDEPEPTDDMEVDWRLLGPTSEKPNPFKLGETRKREALHHRMVDRVARNKRAEKAARVTKTPVSMTPRFASSPRLDFASTPGAGSSRGSVSGGHGQGKMLTPAAQRLLQQVGRTPRSGERKSGLGNAWTPTPKRK